MDDFVSGSGPQQPAGDLAFIPLGGTGEIGMNLNLYRCDGKLLAIDCGIGFGGPDLPEAEIMVPDASWAAERRDRLVGLVITHAHEDHVGAVAHLWPQLRCPIYAGPFVSAVLRRKLAEAGLLGEAQLVTVPLGRSLRNAEGAARECGYLTDIPPYVPEEEAGYIPADTLLRISPAIQADHRS